MHDLTSLRFALGALFALLALGACTQTDGDLGVDAPPAIARVEGAPAGAGSEPDGSAIAIAGAASTLVASGGRVAIGTGRGVFLVAPSGEAASALAVVADEDAGEPTRTGAVSALAGRAGGGLLVAGDEGLFHTADVGGQTVLLPSPARDALGGARVLALDAFGEGAAEEIWLVTAEGAKHVARGAITDFTVPGAVGAPTAAVGFAPGKAVVAWGARVHVVDVPRASVLEVDVDVGATLGATRGDDGRVHLATERGVLTRERAGDFALHTLAPAGAEGARVIAVATSLGAPVAVTEEGLVALSSGDEPSALVAPLPAPVAALRGFALDDAGDAWLLGPAADEADADADASTLHRLVTGAPVSFAASVKPIVEARCATCHADGSRGAPKRAFTDYDVAVDYAAEIASRVREPGPGAMPPVGQPPLDARDVATIRRWALGGTLP